MYQEGLRHTGSWICALMVQGDVTYTVMLSVAWPDLVSRVHCTSPAHPWALVSRQGNSHRKAGKPLKCTQRRSIVWTQRPYSKMPMQPLGWRYKGIEQVLKHPECRDMIGYLSKYTEVASYKVLQHSDKKSQPRYQYDVECIHDS